MERLKGKVSRAALGRSELLARHEQALLRFFMPHKDLQERRVSGVYFWGAPATSCWIACFHIFGPSALTTRC